MCLMELIIKVFKIKHRDLLAILVSNMLVILFYYLLFENSEIVYPATISIFITTIYFLVEIIKYKKFEQALQESKASVDYSTENIDYDKEEIFNVINDIHKDYLNKIYDLTQEKHEKENLFSTWVHNMKTCVTVIDLACEKGLIDENKEVYFKDIKEENNLLKKNLEECLNILRLEDFSRDYITENYNVKKLVQDVVNSKKRDFIYKGVFPKVNIDENLCIYTDKKWCVYMIEQIVSNAIKYSKDKSGSNIIIEATDKIGYIELKVIDEGIGISKEDLSRVFDPFFTGNNGRNDRSATGIGLYMVKLIAKKLGHEVKLESQVEKGTKVIIKFIY